jgi:hypothetical protein
LEDLKALPTFFEPARRRSIQASSVVVAKCTAAQTSIRWPAPPLFVGMVNREWDFCQVIKIEFVFHVLSGSQLLAILHALGYVLLSAVLFYFSLSYLSRLHSFSLA